MRDEYSSNEPPMGSLVVFVHGEGVATGVINGETWLRDDDRRPLYLAVFVRGNLKGDQCLRVHANNVLEVDGKPWSATT